LREVEFTPSTRVLRGLDDIAAYMKVSRRTVFRYIHKYGLPAMNLGVYITTTSLIDLWIIAANSAQREGAKARASIYNDSL
jgi:hypothetical protein